MLPCSGVLCLGAVGAGSSFQPSLTTKGGCFCAGHILHSHTKQPGLRGPDPGSPIGETRGGNQNALKGGRGTRSVGMQAARKLCLEHSLVFNCFHYSL